MPSRDEVRRQRHREASLAYAAQCEADPKIAAREAELRAQIAATGDLDPDDEITPEQLKARLTELESRFA